MPAICALIKRTSAKTVTFPMCAFGASWQKATTRYCAARPRLPVPQPNRDIGLRYETATDASLEGFSDSDWAVKHSTSGFTFHLGSASISCGHPRSRRRWRYLHARRRSWPAPRLQRKRYRIPFLLALRARHGSISATSAQTRHNKSAIDLAYNPEHHLKTKHIERRHHFIRECVENGQATCAFRPNQAVVRLSSTFATR